MGSPGRNRETYYVPVKTWSLLLEGLCTWCGVTTVLAKYILLNQVNNLLHRKVKVMMIGIEAGLCGRNIAPDIFVNFPPGAALGVVFHGCLNLHCGHTTSGQEKSV